MKGRSEKRVLNEALIAVSSMRGVLAWRNNTGQAWQGTPMRAVVGQTIVVKPGMQILMDARPIAFGLPGSGDILGVTQGYGFALEAKTLTGRQSDQQRKFQAAFERAGGVYGVFRSPEEAVRIVVEGKRR